MTWLLWRQHRRQAAVAIGLLGALGILLWITGVTMAHDYQHAISACGQSGADCQGVRLFRGDGFIIDLVNLTVAVPILIGAFWGATAIGREYDTGTNVLVWTQSVTRRRWVRDKISVLLASSVIAGAALSGMVTWWSQTLNTYHDQRFDPLQFDIQGLMPIAYTLFAAALGLVAGVVWRRVLPAIATVVAGFVAVRLPIEQYARPHYASPITRIESAFKPSGLPSGAWEQHSDLVHNGTVVSGPIRVPQGCVDAVTRTSMDRCMQQHGYFLSRTYQPADRYWTFQWIEAGIFVAISALLVALAVVLVRRRDA
jgi:hypothetical protein